MEFELIKKVVAYAEDRFKGKELSFSITSNATLITAEIIEFFSEHNISLMISLDGPEEINNSNRIYANGKGTYADVMKKVKLIQQVAPAYFDQVQISMVMDPSK